MILYTDNLALATLLDDNLLGQGTGLRTSSLNLLNNIVTVNHLTKHNVLAVQPRAGNGGDEKLGAVGVGTRVGHRQQALAGVALVEVLVRELLAVDRLTTVATAGLKVTALQHEARDHTVENGAQVAEALLASAQGAEVLGGLGGDVAPQLKLDGVLQLAVNGGLEVDLGASNSRRGGKHSLSTEAEVLKQRHSGWGEILPRCLKNDWIAQSRDRAAQIVTPKKWVGPELSTLAQVRAAHM